MEGIYKITEAQARQMGASTVDELSVYGQHGPLPQKLDSSAFELNQIQVKKIGNDLYFYLSGPHFHQYENGSFHYQHHPYTDTLYYLVQTRSTAQKPINYQPKIQLQSHSEGSQLYTFHTKKEEYYNILNSGRSWYGNRSFNGQRVNLFFPEVKTSGAIYYSYRVLAQSQAGSEFTFQLNDQQVAKTPVASIPESTYGIKGREESEEGFFDLTANAGIKASFLYTTGNANGTGYLDFITLGYPTAINTLEQGIYHRLDLATGILPDNGNYYWEVGNGVTQLEPGSALPESLRKLAAFLPNSVPAVSTPTPMDINLRNTLPNSELLIISPKELKSQADKLAAHRQKEGISATVILIDDIYNAYSYGSRDVSAIRNFVAHTHQSSGQLKNLLLFGKGSYDYKFLAGGRPNLIPIYTSRGSLNPLATYSSDDYYGFLSWGDGAWGEDNAGDHQLSIGVGRIPVINLREAASVVEKLIAYDDLEANMGEWKRKILLFADDGDNNLHLNDSEKHAALLHQKHPEFQLEKLYLDAFPQVMLNDRQRSPVAEAELLGQVREGVLLINYVGHGNETTLTAEQVFTTTQLADWPEMKNLPVLVTATCEFGRHDSPFTRSGAEDMLTLRGKGAIGLLTTGRPVFSSANFALNKAFMDQVFVREDGSYLTLGEIYQRTKNNSNNGVLNRSFALLGDPSMKLALPDLVAHAEELMDLAVEIEIDTLKSLQKILINGKISDPLTQSTITGFDGDYLITITDKPEMVSTLGNESQATSYLNENTDIFRGTGNVVNGVFSSEVFIPSNIQEQMGRGIIKVYAQDRRGKEALGARSVLIGDRIQNVPVDTDGPIIKMMVADTVRAVTSIPSTTVTFFAFLEDKSGVNISSTNPNQQLILQINGDQEIPLNRHYSALNGSFTQGLIQTTISGLKEGKNILVLTAYDNIGNRSMQTLEVEVEGSLRLQITNHMTFPNPATEYSRFRWTHNRPGENLTMSLRIFNIMGSEIFSIVRRFPNASAILDDMEWIFLQAKTKYPAKGTYIYELVLQSEADGTSDRKSGKLLIQ